MASQDADIASVRHPNRGHHFHHDDDDQTALHPVGPGHSNVNDPTRYVLVTPEMLASMNQGELVVPGAGGPSGTEVVTVVLTADRAPGERIVPTALHSDAADSPGLSSLPGTEKGQRVLHNENIDGSVDSSADPVPYRIAPHMANPITRTRYMFREYLGEFIGTMVLLLFGNGVNCQVVLSELTQGSYLSISFGWGIGVM